MESLITGTADRADLKALRKKERRQAEKRRRKEEKALRREMKRQKRSKVETEEEIQGFDAPEQEAEAMVGMLTFQSNSESALGHVVARPSRTCQPAPPEISTKTPEASPAVPPKPQRDPGPSKRRKTLGKPKFAQREDLDKPTDEELRVRFAVDGAMEAYLASRWTDVAELKRLSDAGGTCLFSLLVRY